MKIASYEYFVIFALIQELSNANLSSLDILKKQVVSNESSVAAFVY